jgi:hypothetical protein
VGVVRVGFGAVWGGGQLGGDVGGL